MVTKSVDEVEAVKSDLVQVSRLALNDQAEDVRLYIARLVRKYRAIEPDLAAQLDSFLKVRPGRAIDPLRRVPFPTKENAPIPIDDESRLTLLKAFSDGPDRDSPLFSKSVEEQLRRLVLERNQIKRLTSLGLVPTRSAVFVGKPGVGKTLTARWLAAQLGVPLYVLDLTAVMSSFLGKSGTNIRAALDFAKRRPCVLLLDELDAIAKRRSDETDVGELKRLVTVILQEVEDWPSNGLLLAATNHPELIDTALWRRFDLIINFELPSHEAVGEATRRFLGPDYELFNDWHEALALAFEGDSFSDIERELQRFRRSLALRTATPDELVLEMIKARSQSLSHRNRIELAVKLAKSTSLSQRTITCLTGGVSKDTIRTRINKGKESRSSKQ